MHNNTTYSGPLLMLLARPADSLCSVIQSWAMAHHWGDLVLCHSIYDIDTRLDDIPSQQPVILIARPAMITVPFMASVLQDRPALRLVGWTSPQQPSSTMDDASILTVHHTDQLMSLIGTFQTIPVSEPTDAGQEPRVTTDTQLDPKNYRLTDDEIDALLGAD